MRHEIKITIPSKTNYKIVVHNIPRLLYLVLEIWIRLLLFSGLVLEDKFKGTLALYLSLRFADGNSFLTLLQT